METKYDIGEKVYLPYDVKRITIGEDKEIYYELRYVVGDALTILERSLLAKAKTERNFRSPYESIKCINWIDCKDRQPNKNGDYLVTVQDDYKDFGGVIRTVEVYTYYTTDGDGESYAGWQTASRVIAWADIPLEAYDGDYK